MPEGRTPGSREGEGGEVTTICRKIIATVKKKRTFKYVEMIVLGRENPAKNRFDGGSDIYVHLVRHPLTLGYSKNAGNSL